MALEPLLCASRRIFQGIRDVMNVMGIERKLKELSQSDVGM